MIPTEASDTPKCVSFSKHVKIAQEDIRALFREPISLDSILTEEKDSILLPSKIVAKKSRHIPETIFLFCVLTIIFCWSFNFRFIRPEQKLLDTFGISAERFDSIEALSLLSVFLVSQAITID